MIFGTDGVRGIVDSEIDAKLAYNIGKGFALGVLKNKKSKKVVIGCDTRTSSNTILSAVCCGLCDYGISVDIVGVVSTPVISYLASRLDYAGGVMITASHNDNEYNGIKLFNNDGEKLDKRFESKVENHMSIDNIKVKNKGQIKNNESLINYYITNLLNTFRCKLSNLTIVVDSANGSNYMIAPYVLKKLGANVIKINCTNNGAKINYKCGANDTNQLSKEVKHHKADLGIAFDGDGDRLRIVLSNGRVLSGDEILFLFAKYLLKVKSLENLTVVGTIMSNLGLEKALNSNGLILERSDVGDKNVIKLMKNNGSILGGEPSGHICLLNYIPTCDALYNSIFLMKAYKKLKIDLCEFFNNSILYPSTSKNLIISAELREDLKSNTVLKKKIKNIKNQYPGYRIVVRPSGTEPVLRLYVEGESEQINSQIVEELENVINDLH